MNNDEKNGSNVTKKKLAKTLPKQLKLWVVSPFYL